ncbi:MAG: GAF domain-containing protein [Desulfuromonadaceae bacterium]
MKLLLGTTKARTAVRKRFSAPIQVRTNEKQFIATAHNLSRTGIFLHSSIIPPKESTIELNVRLANERDIVLLGKVKRIQNGPDGGFGVHFIYPGGAGKKDLEFLLDEANQAQQDEAMATEATASAPSSDTEEIRQLRAENESLRRRIEELERENQDFANRIVTSEEMNNNMTNLYIAASRLHSVLKRSQVVEIINEVVINLIGAEKFVLALHDKQSQSYAFEAGEGLSPEEFPPVCPGSGLLGRIVANGEHFFQQGPVTEGSDDLQQPLAAIPLTYQNTCIGLLAIYRLFTQKEKFAEVDFQLFRMMAEHAAIALCSSSRCLRSASLA